MSDDGPESNHAETILALDASVGIVFVRRPVCLQSQILTVEASYVLAPQETPSIAEARLVQMVRHMAVDRAATDLMSSPVARNAGLSSDQVRVLARALMKTRIVRTTREREDEGERLVVKMQGIITTKGLEAAIPKVQTSHVVSTYLRLQEPVRASAPSDRG